MPRFILLGLMLYSSSVSAAELRFQDRVRLAIAQHSGDREVPMLFAAREGHAGRFATTLEQAGAKVLYRAADVDYIRALVPVARAWDLVADASVDAASVDGETAYESVVAPTRANGAPAALSLAPGVRTSDTTTAMVERARFLKLLDSARTDGPLAPIRDLGLPQFWRHHPTYDGRGATLAVVEGPMDFGLSEFQTARGVDGVLTQKVLEYRSLLDVERDKPQPTWVDMNVGIDASNERFEHGGLVYRVPASGRLRLGFLDERRISYFDGDLDRDGNPEGSLNLFAVVWDESTARVWVDTNQDRDFTDEQGLSDGWMTLRYAAFGPRNTPEKQVRFMVHPTDHPKTIVFAFLNIRHTNMVTSVAAGKHLFGTEMSGAAPNAQVLLVGIPNRMSGAIEAVLEAARDPRTDVVTMQRISDSLLNDGRSVAALVMERVVRRFNKLLFEGAGNYGDFLNVVAERSSGAGPISVGIYENRDTVAALRERHPTFVHAVGADSASGPSESGMIKPDLLAPSLGLAVHSLCCEKHYPNQPHLPAGMRLSGGTSAAAPYAAGAAAVLVSAAKQRGISLSGTRLRSAILNSTRFLEDLPANRQGRGLLNVPAAWRLLEREGAPNELTVSAPVRTVFSHLFPVPHDGAGLFEREGWTTGEKRERRLVLERHNGMPTPLSVGVRILGNDGTFAAPSKLQMPLARAATLPVTVQPNRTGLHTALLQLYDPTDDVVIESVGLNIVAAHRLDTRTSHIEEAGELVLPSTHSVYVHVPEGVAVVSIQVEAQGAPLQIRLGEPTGVESHLSRNLSGNRYQTKPGSHPRGQSYTASQAVAHPTPGVWQIRLEGASPQGTERVSYKLRVRLADLHASASERWLKWTNRGAQTGALSFRALHGTLQEQVDSPRSPSFQRYQVIDIEDRADLVQVQVEVGSRTSTPAITSILTLLDCTDSRCVMRDQATGSGGVLTVASVAPVAGRWVAVVDRIAQQMLDAPLRFRAFVATGETQVNPQDCANGLREALDCSIRVTTDERRSDVLVQAYDAAVETHWYGADTQAFRVLDHRTPAPVGWFLLTR